MGILVIIENLHMVYSRLWRVGKLFCRQFTPCLKNDQNTNQTTTGLINGSRWNKQLEFEAAWKRPPTTTTRLLRAARSGAAFHFGDETAEAYVTDPPPPSCK